MTGIVAYPKHGRRHPCGELLCSWSIPAWLFANPKTLCSFHCCRFTLEKEKACCAHRKKPETTCCSRRSSFFMHLPLLPPRPRTACRSALPRPGTQRTFRLLIRPTFLAQTEAFSRRWMLHTSTQSRRSRGRELTMNGVFVYFKG